MDFDIIIAVIVIGLILISSSRKKKYKKPVGPDPTRSRRGSDPVTVMRSRVRPEKSVLIKYYEDRNNDWLANQMREERASLYRLQEMFSFRMQGKNTSDAELLKEFHMNNCDAGGIDTAAGK